jgi:GxxExxY protein
MKPIPEELNDLSREVVDCIFKVHQTLGPGLLESVYEACLVHELHRREIPAETQVSLPIFYEGIKLVSGLRLDLWVNRQIVIELKAVDEITPLHKSQMLTYMKISECRLGLLVNFNVTLIKNGIVRIAL